MKKVVFSESSKHDLREIWTWIAIDSVGAADAVIDRIRTEIARIGNSPGIGHRRFDLSGNRDYLFWACGRYLIVYEDVAEFVAILAILHGSRDIPAELRNREPGE